MKRHVPLFEDFGNVLKNAGVTAGGAGTEEKPAPVNPDTETIPREKPAPTRRERRDPNRRRPGYVPKENPAKALLNILKEAVHYDDPDKAKMEAGLEDTLRTGTHPYGEHLIV